MESRDMTVVNYRVYVELAEVNQPPVEHELGHHKGWLRPFRNQRQHKQNTNGSNKIIFGVQIGGASCFFERLCLLTTYLLSNISNEL